MKILHIIPNLKKGGAERIVIDIVRAIRQLTDKNNQVKLILFENNIEYGVDDILDLIEIIPSKVQLSISKKNQLDISTLQKAIENFKPDIIHSHLFEGEIVSRSCYYPAAKWFTHLHDRMRSFENLNLFKIRSKRDLTNYFEKKYLLNRYLLNGGNHFIAISEDIEQYFMSALPRKLQQVYLLPNAIDVKRFQKPENHINISNKDICKLISIGRLDKNKNHQLLVDIVSNLKSRNFPVHLEIIGEGDQRKNLESKISNLNLNSEISLFGIRENVQENLWNSALYVHSAISEGFGLTLLEAMAVGLPVISLDGGGNRDLVQEGKNGFLIHSQKVELFSNVIIELFQNQEKYNCFSQNAIDFAKQFDINLYIDKLSIIYKNSI